MKVSIDVLVNNAGAFVPGSVHNEPDGALEEMMAINMFSAYHVTRALIPVMIQQKKRAHLQYVFHCLLTGLPERRRLQY